jgi:hypothetical protein
MEVQLPQLLTQTKQESNTTATVAKMVKGAGQPWAGSKLKWFPVDFFRPKVIKLKVWSPAAGKTIIKICAELHSKKK